MEVPRDESLIRRPGGERRRGDQRWPGDRRGPACRNRGFLVSGPGSPAAPAQEQPDADTPRRIPQSLRYQRRVPAPPGLRPWNVPSRVEHVGGNPRAIPRRIADQRPPNRAPRIRWKDFGRHGENRSRQCEIEILLIAKHHPYVLLPRRHGVRSARRKWMLRALRGERLGTKRIACRVDRSRGNGSPARSATPTTCKRRTEGPATATATMTKASSAQRTTARADAVRTKREAFVQDQSTHSNQQQGKGAHHYLRELAAQELAGLRSRGLDRAGDIERHAQTSSRHPSETACGPPAGPRKSAPAARRACRTMTTAAARSCTRENDLVTVLHAQIAVEQRLERAFQRRMPLELSRLSGICRPPGSPPSPR